MPYLDWDDSYSVGNELIDSQHKRWLKLLNELVEVSVNERAEAVFKAINLLGEYSAEHFRDEENLMEKCNVPNISEHKKEHEEFVNKVEELKDVLSCGVIPFQSCVNFISDWLVEHVTGTDRTYIPYIS